MSLRRLESSGDVHCRVQTGKTVSLLQKFSTDVVHDKSSYNRSLILSLLFLCIHTLARLPYYICTLVKSDILVAPVHVGSVLFGFSSHFYM